MSDLGVNSGHVEKVLVSRSTGEAVGIAFLEDSSLELADLMWSDESKEELVLVKPVVGSEPKVQLLNLPPELLQKKVFKKLEWNDLGQAALVCKDWMKLAVDPMMWKDFPVSSLMRLTIEDFASFLKIKRLDKVRSADIDVPSCNREWLLLEEICNHLGSNLEEIIFRLPVWQPDSNEWILRFIDEKREQGINICADHGDECIDYHWATATPDTRQTMANLIRRTVRGKSPHIRMWGGPNAVLIPNVFELLSSNTEDGRFVLQTNMKIKQVESLDHLQNCVELHLLNEEAIEEEEVSVMNGILAHIAKDPRPQNPNMIDLPKALFMRTTWAVSDILRRSNTVVDCETEGARLNLDCGGDCGGCRIVIEMLPTEEESDDELGDEDEDSEENQLEVEEQE